MLQWKKLFHYKGVSMDKYKLIAKNKLIFTFLFLIKNGILNLKLILVQENCWYLCFVHVSLHFLLMIVSWTRLNSTKGPLYEFKIKKYCFNIFLISMQGSMTWCANVSSYSLQLLVFATFIHYTMKDFKWVNAFI